MFKLALFESYQSVPWMGFGGGATDTYTGAVVLVGTVVAVHWIPDHLHVRELAVYVWPTVGEGGKLKLIFTQRVYKGFYPTLLKSSQGIWKQIP